MKITFLGTGTSQGIPVINNTHPVCFSKDFKDKRLRSSIAVEWDDFRYIIDCGPDFRYQMLRANIQKINGIVFTHEHSDHSAGMDDIRPFFFDMGPIPVYAHKRVLENFTKRFDYIFSDENKYPGAPSVIQHEISNESFELNGLKVTPVDFLHGNLQVFGFRFKDFCYITDLKTISQEEKEKLKGLKVLVINALQKEKHFTHLNLEEALEIIKEVKPERAYLTHISHKLGFHEEVEKELPENVFLAYDGLEVEI
ncbi:MBL fold metallo-hydrolase [Aureivirga sp. CE67]|uniref:MBL fold metallo-hydrolase n=1 Tax=Aureivirga sp. CE67 TaxID=1788983 RepID=UPI0018CBBD4B|nr:MBL fold metallo-hydrolase [Aureivirga sp. CE67]